MFSRTCCIVEKLGCKVYYLYDCIPVTDDLYFNVSDYVLGSYDTDWKKVTQKRGPELYNSSEVSYMPEVI